MEDISRNQEKKEDFVHQLGNPSFKLSSRGKGKATLQLSDNELYNNLPQGERVILDKEEAIVGQYAEHPRHLYVKTTPELLMIYRSCNIFIGITHLTQNTNMKNNMRGRREAEENCCHLVC